MKADMIKTNMMAALKIAREINIESNPCNQARYDPLVIAILAAAIFNVLDDNERKNPIS